MYNISILVVDDNLVSRLLPGFLLKRSHPQVGVFDCEGANEALNLVRFQKVTHVLLDISMPGLDGIQLAKMLKENSKFSKIILIAYTADADLLDSSYFRCLGFDGVLLKPISRENLTVVLGLEG